VLATEALVVTARRMAKSPRPTPDSVAAQAGPSGGAAAKSLGGGAGEHAPPQHPAEQGYPGGHTWAAVSGEHWVAYLL
jgi:hypothetical protein